MLHKIMIVPEKITYREFAVYDIIHVVQREKVKWYCYLADLGGIT